MIYVINRRRPAGSVPAGATVVYVGRPTPLGNKFTHKPTGTLAEVVVSSRYEAVECYYDWLEYELLERPASRSAGTFNVLVRLARRGDLYLECWCAPMLCHAHVLAERLMKEVSGG